MAHYTSEMLAALARGFPGDELRAFAPGGRPRQIPGVRLVGHRLPSRAIFGAAALTGRPRLDALLGGGLDVVWIPAPAPVAVSPRVPYVLTLHDLSWVDHPDWFTPYERIWHRLGRLRRLAERAAIVVAVSEATRAAAADRWGLEPHRIRVVHSGVPAAADPAPRPAWLPERYVLAVGALEPRKSPRLLVDAYAEARRRGLDAELVLAGRGRLVDGLRRPGVHVASDADRPLLERLYRDALAVAAPSRDEGFGFTPLEAARAGTPSVVSDLPVYGETLGGAALRVPADDREAWSEALVRIGEDERLRAELAERARRAASRLSWTEATRGLHDALEEAARR